MRISLEDLGDLDIEFIIFSLICEFVKNFKSSFTKLNLSIILELLFLILTPL
jgi:hypothetical protein